MFSVVIVSAGNSTRMKGINKQFLDLDGVPVIIRTVMAFDYIDDVCEIIVVSSNNMLENTINLFSQYKFNKNINFTTGGNTRQESVFNGISLVCDESDYIAIHDGARPLISKNTIEFAFLNAKKYNATTVGVPVKDTIKILSNGFIESTPPREKLFITQTPQVFEKKLYINAMQKAIAENKDFTDDCQLIESFGEKIFMTIGEYTNIKITTPEDVNLASSFLEGR